MSSNNLKFEVAIVCHKIDVPQLLILLKSIDLYFDPFVSKINLVVQGTKEDFEWFQNTIPEKFQFKRLPASLNLISQQDLIGDLNEKNGWFVQQLLKLIVASRVGSELLLMLDCKHVFIKQITLDVFFNQSRSLPKMLIASQRSHLGTGRGNCFINCCEYFSVGYSEVIDNTLPTVTPYIFYRDVAKEMIAHVENREHTSFVDFFSKNFKNFTEFYFYAAYLHSIFHIEDIYIKTGNHHPIIWNDDDLFNKKLSEKLVDNKTFSIGVHRRVFVSESEDVKLGIKHLLYASLGE